MRHSTIAKITRNGKVPGYIVQIEDQCWLLGICGGFEKDDRPMDEITEELLKKGRNPQTGEEVTIAASKKVSFTVSKELKEAVQ